MNKFIDWFQKKWIPVLSKIGENRIMIALRNGISIVIPITIIGSIFNIIAYFPVDGWTELLGPFQQVLEIPATASMGIMALIATVGVAYNLAKEYEVEPLTSSIVALTAFVVTQTNNEYIISTDNFGVNGLFLGMIVAIISVNVIRLFVKREMVVKLPDSVPPMVYSSFEMLIPAVVNVLLAWVFAGVLGIDLIEVIGVVLSPLVQGVSSLPGLLMLFFFTCLLWCCGINGDSVFEGISYPIFMAALAENAAAFAAGDIAPNISAYGIHYFGMWLGGTGGTLGLVILMMRSKAKLYNQLGKLTIGPGIFCINEPVTYGFPIVFNPIMMIPYILTPIVTITITYLLMQFNIIGRVVAMIPWTTPPVLSGYLATGGDIRAAIWQIVCILISIAIYYPFFKVCERQELLVEAGGKKEEIDGAETNGA